MVGEPTAWRLLSVHNLAYVFALVAEARAAVMAGTLEAVRRRTAATWGA
jgi:queuine tRNA-ribosyltransferase